MEFAESVVTEVVVVLVAAVVVLVAVVADLAVESVALFDQIAALNQLLVFLIQDSDKWKKLKLKRHLRTAGFAPFAARDC